MKKSGVKANALSRPLTEIPTLVFEKQKKALNQFCTVETKIKREGKNRIKNANKLATSKGRCDVRSMYQSGGIYILSLVETL